MAPTSTLKMLLFSSRSPPLNVKKPMCHRPGSAISVRTTLYLLQVFFGRKLSLPVALYPFLFFLFRHPSKTDSLSLLPRESTPTLLACTGLSPAFSIVFHDAPSSPRLLSTANSSKVQLLYHQIFVVTLLTQIGRAGLRHTIDNYRKLPETEGFVTAAIITPKHGPLWDADRAWHEAYFFCFLSAQVL